LELVDFAESCTLESTGRFQFEPFSSRAALDQPVKVDVPTCRAYINWSVSQVMLWRSHEVRPEKQSFSLPKA
jgi:hypothetical protein